MPNVRGIVLFTAFLVARDASPKSPLLRGAVLDERERPVEGAVVLAGERGRFRAVEPVEATSGADGSFELALKSSERVLVNVFADGFLPFTTHDVDPEAPLRVVLRRGGGVLEGVVRDGTTRDPIEGAIVEARSASSGGLYLSSRPRLGILESRTDASGAFRIEGVGPGRHGLSASAVGYGRAERYGTSEDRVELFLFPGAGVYGVVLDPDDRPIADAVLTLRPKGRFLGRGSAPSPCASDFEGRFAFLGVEPGEYALSVRHEDYAPLSDPEIHVEADRDLERVVTLEKGTSIVGRIVDGEDRPLAGEVVLSEPGGAVSFPPDRDPTAVAAADGTFELPRVPMGDHRLVVRARGYAPSRLDVSILRTDRVEDLGDVVLEPGLSIRGRVVSASAAGVPGIRVLGYRRSPGEGSFPFETAPETLSEADGAFVLSGLEAGTYGLMAEAPGVGRSIDVPVEAGDENVRIVLEPVGSVRGVVVDSRGRPLSGAQLSLQNVDGSRRYFGMAEASADDGSFLIEDLTVGEHVLFASAPGHAQGVVSGVEVEAGLSTSVGTVRLARGGTIRGVVVDPSGAPVSGARVTALAPTARRMSMRGIAENEVTTLGDGRFEIGGLAQGPVEVVASHPAFAEGRASASIDGEAEASVEIRLSIGGRLEGYVRSTRGLPPGRSILVIPGSDPRMFGRGNTTASVGEDGYFAIEGIPAGSARVVLLMTAGHRTHSLQSRDVEIRDSETTWVEIESSPVRVQGLVRKGGAPLAGAELEWTSQDDYGVSSISMAQGAVEPSGPQFHRAVTGEDGYFELFVDRPGIYGVRASVVSGGLPVKTVTIPETDAFTLDLDYGGAAIAGRVVDADTGAPISGANTAARPRESRGQPGATWMTTGADGVFTLEVEPGSYTLRANVEGYGARELPLSVGPEGRRDVVIALSKGAQIRGVLRDSQGRVAGNVRVVAVADDPDPVLPAGVSSGTASLPDGTYVLPDLSPGRYNVLAYDPLRGFAFAPGIAAGAENADLTLRPGGTIEILVIDESGAAVSAAIVAVIAIEGRKVRGIQAMTDGEGRLELEAPSGNLLLKSVKGDALEGLARVVVGPGARVPAEIVLRAK